MCSAREPMVRNTLLFSDIALSLVQSKCTCSLSAENSSKARSTLKRLREFSPVPPPISLVSSDKLAADSPVRALTSSIRKATVLSLLLKSVILLSANTSQPRTLCDWIQSRCRLTNRPGNPVRHHLMTQLIEMTTGVPIDGPRLIAENHRKVFIM